MTGAATGGPGGPGTKDGGRLALARFVPYRLSVLANQVSHALARLYASRHGLTIAEWRLMAVLGEGAPRSAGEVAALTAMDKVRVSRAVHGLRRRGLLDRRPDAGDRRRAALRLTAEGAAVYRRIVPLARALEAELMAALDPAERAELDRLLAKLQRRAETLAS